MTTIMATKQLTEQRWYLVDATDQVLGRLASELAKRLRGKNKAAFIPNDDVGDFFVVINVDKIRLTGNKPEKKMYYRHTNHPGGIKGENFITLHGRAPERVLELALKGMLPSGPLGRRLLTKIKIYSGDKHPHTAQKPELVKIVEKK
ncbi:MAG TPA: 50S ribosomal protein L13 [Coxiellaceae bacterium]|nr:50S ribosomal protein L13 [Coxiellaceae bacterium]